MVLNSTIEIEYKSRALSMIVAFGCNLSKARVPFQPYRWYHNIAMALRHENGTVQYVNTVKMENVGKKSGKS